MISDTDGDRIPDSKESLGNLTQIEGSDPKITLAKAEFVLLDYVFGIPTRVTVKVTIVATDDVGVDSIAVIPGLKVLGKFVARGKAEKALCDPLVDFLSGGDSPAEIQYVLTVA